MGDPRSTAAPAAPGTPGTPVAPGAPSVGFLAAAYGFAVVLGAALGLYGAFLAPAGPRPGGVLLSVGVALAVVGNGCGAVLVHWLTGTRLGACILLAGWVPVVLWFGTGRPEGDLVLRTTTTSYVFLVAGALVPVAVAVLVRPTRGLFGPPDTIR